MAVNTSVLRVFAPAMRRKLIEGVGRKLDLLINTKTPDILTTYAKQIENLREEQDQNREQLIEKVAYTWFNRFCAFRYLDAKGWHPFACKVLMPAKQDETQPELLKLMRSGSLPTELKRFTNEQRLNQLLDNQISTALKGGDPQAEVYRELVLAACRSYHHILPDLFERIEDSTELLLPDDLLTESSIAGRFRKEISDSDCEDVEIIGWLYQFYISEKKDEVIGKVVKSEDIPAATQLFTPNWIVKYMVQNTIGAQWLATYPDSPLREQMEFYIEPAEQNDEVKSKMAEITPTSLNPEELTLMDPACGSGHILVEAYNVFRAIYLEQGYQRSEIPELILTRNLYGLDICPRAAQLATFSLLMKGREDDRRSLERGVELNILSMKNSTDINIDYIANNIELSSLGLSRDDLIILSELFRHTTTYGSLIQIPSELKLKLSAINGLLKQPIRDPIWAIEVKRLSTLTKQAIFLAKTYHTVIANPPYMGSKFQTPILRKYLDNAYKEYSKDFFSVFIKRSLIFSKKNSGIGIVSPFVWMFISSYEKLRQRVLNNTCLTSLIQLEYNAFEPACIPVACFTLKTPYISDYKGKFIKLSEFKGHQTQEPKTLEAIKDPNCIWMYKAKQDNFKKIPGFPIAYWMTENVINAFQIGTPLGEISSPRKGNTTTNNNRFVRSWPEVDLCNIGLNLNSYRSQYRWIPYNKGGGYLKWYGHNSYLIDWKDQGSEIRKIPTAVIANESLYFQPGLTWGTVASNHFSIRWFGQGFIFDTGGCCVFGAQDLRLYLLALLNSSVFPMIIGSINPTLNFTSGAVAKFPVVVSKSIKSQIETNSSTLLKIGKYDWDSYERSWEFQSSPLLIQAYELRDTIENSYIEWISRNNKTISEMKFLEETNNRLFTNAYALEKEIVQNVPVPQITLRINPSYRYGGSLSEEDRQSRFQSDTMAELLSYSTGCIMGRYSLDHPGLILADSRESQEAQISAYEAKVGKQICDVKFKPDLDGIIPVLDGEWFEDDIVARTRDFLSITFPESSVVDNLRFIENSIGKDIRKYFCRDFYKDHLQTYKKRPIYWMVQSPNAGFACLIYLHRYTPETLLQVLNDYFRPYVQKLEARLTLLDLDQVNDSLSKREQIAARKEAEKINKVIKECQDWEKEALLPLAQKRIKLDLDDGVNVNYLKLQDVLAKITGLKVKVKK